MQTASFAFLPCADSAEAMTRAGIDRVIIDREHASTTWSEVREMIRAVQGNGGEAFVRVRAISNEQILPALELGVDGIVAPFVGTPEIVRHLRDICRYPPLGDRGTCTLTRAAAYGLKRGAFAEHARYINANTKIIGLLEESVSDADIKRMAEVKGGLDGVLIGRSDLAAGLGKPGEVQDAEVLQISRRMLAACEREGLGDRGVLVYSPAEIDDWSSTGVTWVAYGADVSILAQAYSAFVTASASGE